MGKITEVEQLRHFVRNELQGLALGYHKIVKALADGVKKDCKAIATTQLMKHEGFEPRPYRCTAGKLTIGFGINLETEAISYEVALLWLENKVEECDKLLSKELSFYMELTDNRKSVLINMCFNLGFKGFMKFKRMISALEIEDYKTASKEMVQSRWASQVGNRAIELQKLMENG